MSNRAGSLLAVLPAEVFRPSLTPGLHAVQYHRVRQLKTAT